MKNTNYRNGNCRYLIIAVACCVALLLPLSFSKSFGESPELSSTSQETLRLGERMYRDGNPAVGKTHALP